MAAVKTPPKIPTYSRGKVSAQGVLAQLESIEPILRRHRQAASGKITGDLLPKVKNLIPTLGVQQLPEEKISQIATEVAQETTRQTLEDVSRIQSADQIQDVVANSLAESLLAHPDLETQIKTEPDQIFQKIYDHTQEVVSTNQKTLEEEAVLGNIANLAKLQKPDQQTLDLVAKNVQQTVEAEAALLPPEDQSRLVGSLGNYLTDYVDQINKRLPGLTQKGIPTLDELAKVKEDAHDAATAKIGTTLAQTVTGQQSAKVGYQTLTSNLAQNLGTLKTKTPTKILNLPLGARLIVSSPKNRDHTLHALLAHDEEWLTKQLKETEGKIAHLKKQKSLSLKDKKELARLKPYLNILSEAQTQQVKHPKRTQGLRYQIAKPFGGNALKLSQTAQNIIQNTIQQQGAYVPAFLLLSKKFSSEIVLSQASHNLGLNLGISFSLPKIPSLGMGISKIKGFTPATFALATAATVGAGIFKKALQIGSKVLGALGLYALGLGQAVFAGFVVGALVGGTAGAIAGAVVGAQIGAAIGTFILPGVGTVIGGAIGGIIGGTIGFFTGAAIGGIAGALTALGLATGSTTVTATGVGMSIGATAGFVIGGPPGAIMGAALGAVAGYLVGNYVIPFVKNAVGAITSGTVTVGGGLISGAIGLVTTLFNGIISLGGTAIGLAGSLGSSLLSAIGIGGGAAVSTPLVASIVAGPIVGIGTLGIVTGIITATSFIATAEEGSATPGQNQFFTLTKTVDRENVPNPPPAQSVTFTIRIKAKDVALTNITIVDELRVQAKNNNFTLPQDPCSSTIPPRLDPGQPWECPIVITMDDTPGRDYTDGTAANTVTLTVTPESQSPQTESVTAIVVVGTPPANCPRRWPAIGFISQGPEGATSHGNLAFGEYEALDIAQSMGNNVYATVEGTVDFIYIARNDRNDHRIRIKPTSCLGLTTINYWHLSAVAVSQGQTVTFGQKIGETGAWNGAPHTHYQFNEVYDRSFPIKAPYVPVTVPRVCDGYEECGKVDITSAP